jgi:hypothetical protein
MLYVESATAPVQRYTPQPKDPNANGQRCSRAGVGASRVGGQAVALRSRPLAPHSPTHTVHRHRVVPRTYLDDLLVRLLRQHLLVNANVTELVLDDGESQAMVRRVEDVVEQRRLAGPEEPSQNRDLDRRKKSPKKDHIG